MIRDPGFWGFTGLLLVLIFGGAMCSACSIGVGERQRAKHECSRIEWSAERRGKARQVQAWEKIADALDRLAPREAEGDHE